MIDLHLIDYNTCHEYARSLCGQHGIPPCDTEDIGSDAFLLSIRRAWFAEAEESPESVAKRLMYTATIDVIRRRNTFANRIIREADDIDATQAPDYGEPTDDEAIDDAPSCCRTLVVPTASWPGTTSVQQQVCAPTYDDDWEYPFWLRLFDLERQKLRNEKRRTPEAPITLKLINAGLKDSRLSLLCDSLQISWGHFQTILNFFKERFALCFQALRAWRADF